MFALFRFISEKQLFLFFKKEEKRASRAKRLAGAKRRLFFVAPFSARRAAREELSGIYFVVNLLGTFFSRRCGVVWCAAAP